MKNRLPRLHAGYLCVGRLCAWLFLAGAILAIAHAPATAGEANFSTSQKSAIGDIIKDYLLKNPEVVRDALIQLEQRQQVAEAEQQKLAVSRHADELFRAPGDFVIGNPQGDVTLVEFFDYNCGFCKRALDDLNKLIENDTNLRIVLKEFPILSAGSVEAARLSLAAGMQGKYLEFHRTLLASRGQADGERALQVAQTLGLDLDRMKADAEKDSIRQTITLSMRLASALSINGTPSYVIGNEVVIGAVGYGELKEKISAARTHLAREGD